MAIYFFLKIGNIIGLYMSLKTNKSYLKRLKVTKTGKLVARKSGRNHFNAKERHSAKSTKGKNSEFHMSNKERSRFLANF